MEDGVANAKIRPCRPRSAEALCIVNGRRILIDACEHHASAWIFFKIRADVPCWTTTNDQDVYSLILYYGFEFIESGVKVAEAVSDCSRGVAAVKEEIPIPEMRIWARPACVDSVR